MEWTRGHTLGRGSTAAVYMAESRQSGQVFAVKSAELHRSEFLKREERILSMLKCPQIVAYQGCDVTLENGVRWFNVFMEYAPHGTLAERGGCMEEAVVGFYTRQILQGLNYLHENGIVHCDLKGQNVLVTEKGVKIADLGCARRVGEEFVIAGTPAFMAPEVARGEQQGFPADVWALGCTVLEMITGKAPWHGGGDPAAVVYRIGFSGEVPEIPSFMSEQGRDFLGKCLKREASERWSVEELLGHGFVKECTELNLLLLDSDTPTCVLERGFWDSLETTHHGARECPSPRDRIRRLFSDEPVWDDGDEWVTVRSNEVPLEGLSLSKTDTFSYMVCDETGLVTFCEPNIVVATVIELSRWNWNAISEDDCYLRGTYCVCRSRESLSVFVCLVIVSYQIFDSHKMRIFIIRCFLLLLSLFNFTLDQFNTFPFHYYHNIIWDNVCVRHNELTVPNLIPSIRTITNSLRLAL
ncbi:mitogen-activated protein kinase kinase kinase 18 [Cajanus cajan]|uniref:Mitogen-activated protein kinase kinase kinase A n=1 Tax=Cajanus cajan TaxID=3821 RepID=A0A151T6R2_CAJCA|nr:mitogen-activated protein kinase kinase kinase 18 [Cajanus cajan]KYP62748.1 Mitogen-activated protein kinase kinase kinase A [Cajanus cajan]